MIRTSIAVPARIWTLLRRLSEEHVIATGGRPSVAAVVSALVEAEERRREEASRRA